MWGEAAVQKAFQLFLPLNDTTMTYFAFLEAGMKLNYSKLDIAVSRCDRAPRGKATDLFTEP